MLKTILVVEDGPAMRELLKYLAKTIQVEELLKKVAKHLPIAVP